MSRRGGATSEDLRRLILHLSAVGRHVGAEVRVSRGVLRVVTGDGDETTMSIPHFLQQEGAALSYPRARQVVLDAYLTVLGAKTQSLSKVPSDLNEVARQISAAASRLPSCEKFLSLVPRWKVSGFSLYLQEIARPDFDLEPLECASAALYLELSNLPLFQEIAISQSGRFSTVELVEKLDEGYRVASSVVELIEMSAQQVVSKYDDVARQFHQGRILPSSALRNLDFSALTPLARAPVEEDLDHLCWSTHQKTFLLVGPAHDDDSRLRAQVTFSQGVAAPDGLLFGDKNCRAVPNAPYFELLGPVGPNVLRAIMERAVSRHADDCREITVNYRNNAQLMRSKLHRL